MTKIRMDNARPAGMLGYAKYPMGRFDIEYRLVSQDGEQGKDVHTLRLLLSDDEARQMGDKLLLLSRQIDAMGGTKQ